MVLESKVVKVEYARINREALAILDEMLAVKPAAVLAQAQVAERMGTKAPAVARLESALASGKPPALIPCVNMHVRLASALKCI